MLQARNLDGAREAPGQQCEGGIEFGAVGGAHLRPVSQQKGVRNPLDVDVTAKPALRSVKFSATVCVGDARKRRAGLARLDP